MTSRRPRWLRFDMVCLVALALYPVVIPGSGYGLELTDIFIFALLALGLNVVVGYTGLLHLGIAAFFGIGAYLTGILTARVYPFQIGFTGALIASAAGAALCGLILGAPTLRLRGDYLALVTLGFGEMAKFSIRNLQEITAGTKGLNPIPPPSLPEWASDGLTRVGISPDWAENYRLFYYLCLVILVLVFVMLRRVERSRIGRAWMAIREDELAATCMGINATRAKLTSFALGAALAGLAGCLYATTKTTTTDPNAFDFNRSIIMLCCIILGGLGSLEGTLLGVFVLVGFDTILAPALDSWLQQSRFASDDPRLTFTAWRYLIFGLALILTMRFRPEGLLPSSRVRREMHQNQLSALAAANPESGHAAG